MSQHMFGVRKGKMTAVEKKRCARAARKHDADFVGPVDLPGNGWQSWFTCENQGHPFDRATAQAVRAELGEELCP